MGGVCLRAFATKCSRPSAAGTRGPTLAHEKLVEEHGLAPSLETFRLWMAAAGLWQTRKERRKRPQPPRARRACLGELIQSDGSDHEWFEDRGPRCTLLVYVDDATSRLMELRFVWSESTFDYFALHANVGPQCPRMLAPRHSFRFTARKL